MSDPCRELRDAWLEAASGGDERGVFVGEGHRSECPACDDWCRRAVAVTKLLRELPRRAAPSTLAAAVANEIEPGSAARFARLLGGLEPRQAPAELEQRLAGEAFYATLLGRLGSERAPGVLERLVAEELADPAARVRHFAGGLERQAAPRSLARRLVRLERPPVRGGLVPLAAGLAAALLLWIGLRRGAEPSYHFTVRYATDLSALDPLAVELGGALGGAAGAAVEAAPEPAAGSSPAGSSPAGSSNGEAIR